MKFTEWLDAKKGRAKAVAEHFNVSPGAITQWRIAIPRNRMRSLHAFTDGVISYDEMVPATAEEHALEAQLTEAAQTGLIERRTTVRRAADRATPAAMKGQGA